MVIAILAYFLEIIVFSTDPQALLGIRYTEMGRGSMAKKKILERVHAGVCKEQCGIVLRDHRSGWHNRMSPGFEKLQKHVSDLVGGYAGFCLQWFSM
jgi:hypothetical protein